MVVCSISPEIIPVSFALNCCIWYCCICPEPANTCTSSVYLNMKTNYQYRPMKKIFFIQLVVIHSLLNAKTET